MPQKPTLLFQRTQRRPSPLNLGPVPEGWMWTGEGRRAGQEVALWGGLWEYGESSLAGGHGIFQLQRAGEAGRMENSDHFR